jgi:hypothetical protein
LSGISSLPAIVDGFEEPSHDNNAKLTTVSPFYKGNPSNTIVATAKAGIVQLDGNPPPFEQRTPFGRADSGRKWAL